MRQIKFQTILAVPAAVCLVLLALVSKFTPSLVLAQSDSASVSPYASWSVEQLCAQRADDEVWEEIERRDLFDRRELAAIRRDRVIVGIREEALFCVRGEPDSIVLALATANRIPVDAYIYRLDESESLIVHIRHVDGESRIERVYDADNEEVEELKQLR